jgi:hypothetical protein
LALNALLSRPEAANLAKNSCESSCSGISSKNNSLRRDAVRDVMDYKYLLNLSIFDCPFLLTSSSGVALTCARLLSMYPVMTLPALIAFLRSAKRSWGSALANMQLQKTGQYRAARNEQKKSVLIQIHQHLK